MSHIDFDEIVSYALCDRIDSEYLELAARINRHVMTCPECLKMYKAINSFFDSFENITLTHPTDKRMVRILESIYKNGNEEKMLEHLIADFRAKIKHNPPLMNINIKSNDEIYLSSSAFDETCINEKEPKTDDKFLNKFQPDITLSNEGTLSFKFGENSIKAGEVMYLLSDNDVSLQIAKENEDGTLEVSYDGIEQGEYSILL